MKLALIGYGKMGKAIEEHVHAHNLRHANTIEIVLRISNSNKHLLTRENLQQCDAAIEFSRPDAAVANIKCCIDAGVPVAVGTTGWYDRLPEIENYCKEKNGTVLHAANFSIGVNIFFEINKRLAELMAMQKQYTVSVTETHHTQKLDAPSGTAIKIAEGIMEKMPFKKHWVNKATPDPAELEILSHRIENVPGTHVVTYQAEADEIQLAHIAHSRMGFAEGAVLAALWIMDRKGIFTMQDVLGF